MVVSVLLGGLVVGWLIDGFLKEGLHSQLWETPMWLGNRLQLPPRISAHVLAGSHRARNFRGVVVTERKSENSDTGIPKRKKRT